MFVPSTPFFFPALSAPLALRRTRENPFPTVLWPVLWEHRDRIAPPPPPGECPDGAAWLPMPKADGSMAPVCPSDERYSQAQALNAPRAPLAFVELPSGASVTPFAEVLGVEQVAFLPEGAPSGDAIRIRGRATFPCESVLEARIVEIRRGEPGGEAGHVLRVYVMPAPAPGVAKCSSPFVFEGMFPVAWVGHPKGLRVQVIAVPRPDILGHDGRFEEQILHDLWGPPAGRLPGGVVAGNGFITGNEGCPICGTYAWDTRFMRPVRASDGSTHHPSCTRVRAPIATPSQPLVAESKETWDYADPYGRVGDAFMNRPRPRVSGCGVRVAGCMPGGASIAGYMLGKLAEFRTTSPAQVQASPGPRAQTPCDEVFRRIGAGGWPNGDVPTLQRMASFYRAAASDPNAPSSDRALSRQALACVEDRIFALRGGRGRPRVAGTPLFFTQTPPWATPILQEISHRDYPTACIDQLGDVSTSLALARAVYDSRSAAHLDQLAETLLAHLSTQQSIFGTHNAYLIACAYNELKMQAARLRMQGLY